jgi:hypothetical protein
MSLISHNEQAGYLARPLELFFEFHVEPAMPLGWTMRCAKCGQKTPKNPTASTAPFKRERF